MDTDRFDQFTRSAVSGSRRAALGAFGIFALSTLGVLDAEGKKRKKRKGKKGNHKKCPPGLILQGKSCVELTQPAVDCAKKTCGSPDGKGGICKNGYCPEGLTCHQVLPLEKWSCFCTDLLFECPPNSCGPVQDKCGITRQCGNCGEDGMCINDATKCCTRINRPCERDSDCCYHDLGRVCSSGVCTDS